VRVQILTQFYPPEISAASVRLDAMVDEFVRRGHDVDIVTAMPSYPVARIFDGYRGRLLSVEELKGATVWRVWIYAAVGSGVRRVLNFASFAALAPLAMARTPRPDVILVESPPLFAVIPAIVDRFARRRHYGLLVADLWPDTAVEMGMLPNGALRRALYWLERIAYRHAELIAPVTHAQVRALRTDKGVPADRLHLVRNGVDLELFAPGAPTPEVRELLSPNGERVIIFAGTLGYAQGLDVILDAAPVVRAAHPDARFVLVGAGSDAARVRSRVEAEAIAGVDLLPPRPLAQIAELYKGAFAGLTSLRASPVFEAARPSKIFPMMAAGLPIVYSGRGEGADLIASAGAGVVAVPEDPDALARAVIGLLDEPDAAVAMGRNGRRLVEADLSWSQIMEEFIDHLERRIGVDRMH
jgi:putative colanic acid biosynthesis glycosyltransferase WcaI